jgi:hypothetical protein
VTITTRHGQQVAKYEHCEQTKTFHIVIVNTGIDGDAYEGFAVEVSKPGYKSWSCRYTTMDFVQPDGEADARRIDEVFLVYQELSAPSRLLAGAPQAVSGGGSGYHR